ncbi:MAG: hypothetical protein V4563_18215 [Pseudomonadota bacterium]
MYYHGSPTPHQIKAIKRAKAAEMKAHTDAMKRITAKYSKTLTMLETLRDIELQLDNAIHQERLSADQIAEAQRVLARNRRKAARLVEKITSVKQ